MSAPATKKVAPGEAGATFQGTNGKHETPAKYTLSPDASLEILHEMKSCVAQMVSAIARMQATAARAVRQ